MMQGQTIKTEVITANEGDTIELDRVLMISDDNGVTVGHPTVPGAKVVATSLGDGKAKKVIVFKYKAKTRARKKTGHRQLFTSLAIKEIVAPGAAVEVT